MPGSFCEVGFYERRETEGLIACVDVKDED
jgi:hypothetical protein